MSLLESGENYLESVYKLSLSKNEVHAIDVVNDLNFSKPSVSIMLKKLKDEGYLTIDNENHLHLTEVGLKIAMKIYDRHTTLKNILLHLGVKDEVAEEDACKIEHDLTDESFDAIKKYYNEKIKWASGSFFKFIN